MYGVPALVPEGESIHYSAASTVSDPKVCGIIANGYPHIDLVALGCETVEEAYYATKTALWIYLLGTWSLDGLGINPTLSGADRAAAQRVLKATRDIYYRGMLWDELVTPKLTATGEGAPRLVTVGGTSYYQQTVTVSSDTWAIGEAAKINVAAGAPSGTRLVDMSNNDISQITLSTSGSSFQGRCRLLVPAAAVEENTTVQINATATVVQYALYYARSLEADKYGEIQDYILDTDPHLPMSVSYTASFSPQDDDDDDSNETRLKIVKLEEGTETPLEGAIFRLTDPDGASLGSYTTGWDGTVTIPLTRTGHYTVEEIIPPKWHLLDGVTTRHATVLHGQTAIVTFTNAPYGSLRIEKMSDTGEPLRDVTIQIKHIESGATQTGKTGAGGAIVFDRLTPGGYEVRETAGIPGWQVDESATQNVTVVSGQTSTVTIINKELPGLRIVKYDRSGQKHLADITFEIRRDGTLLGQFRTDQMGEILLLDAQPGTYLVQEVASDADHIVDSTPQQIELKAGDGIRQLVFFNDRKPGIHLVKVDSADLNTPIPNVKFRIQAVNGSFGPKDFLTQADGTIDLSNLDPGTYLVEELECPGYVVDKAQRVIELKPNETAQFVFTNSKLPSVRLLKSSSDGTPLAGVTFRLAKIEDGSRYLDRKTNAAGEILWEGLEPGVYSLTETASLPDHIRDTQEYHVELFPGKTSTIVLKNSKRPSITVWKHDADTGEPIAETVFSVQTADGHSVGEIKTDAEGKGTLKNLLPGVYEIEEKRVPSPYLKDAPSQLVTLYPDRDRDVYFVNHKSPSIEIIKEDSVTHERLPNVRFQVWYASNNTSTGELNDLGIFTTDKDGTIRLTGPDNGLRDGWFRVKELEPPQGYSIQGDGVQEAFVQAGKSHTFRFENTPLSALVVWKYDSVTGAPVEGCVFQIKYMSGTSGSGGTVIGTYKTGPNGSFTVNQLEAGAYLVEELASDSNHVMDTAPQTAYISGKEQDVVELYFGNSPKSAVLIKKIDSVTREPLSDCEFFITDSHGTMLGDANGKFVTDSAGTILISNIDPGTTIVARETRAKENYILDDVPQTATVKAGQTVTLEFRNQPKGSVTLYKFSSSDRRTPLEGVGFKITFADGKAVDNIGGQQSSSGIYYTNSQGQIHISGVTGTLIFSEVSTIPGYLIDENRKSQTVVVNPAGHQSVCFYNIPESTLIIEKYLETESGNEPLKGVTFLVTDSGGAVIGSSNGEFITGEDGRIVIDGVAPGTTVTAREIKAPDGVVLDSTPKTIKISGSGANTLRFYNKKTGYLVVRKLDKVTKAPLSGAEFELTYADGSFVDDNYGHLSSKGLYTTNANGEIRVSVTGTVVVKETKCLPGYTMDPATSVQTVVVNPADTQTITVYNAPKQTLTLQKYVDGTTDPIQGVTFLITDSSGQVLGPNNGEYITDQNGRIVLNDLTPGTTITAKETKTVSGFVLDTTPQSILIKEGAAQTLTFFNKTEGGLELIKVNESDKTQRIKGATFEIRKMDGALVETVTTGSNGRVHVSLDAGDYYAVETDCPSNFKLDATPHCFTVADGKTTTLTVTNKPFSGILLHKTDSTTKKGIYGAVFLLYDSGMNPIGQYTSDNNGYVYIDDLTISGRYYLREMENEGYIVDTQLKTVQVRAGKTTEVEWENTPITGQIQILKTSEDYNSTNGWPAGTPIPGTEFEIYHSRTGQLVDTIRTDRNGVAVSRPLPLGRYKVVESKAADFYMLDKTPIEVKLEFAGQIVKASMTNKSLSTSVSIRKTGYAEVMPGQSLRYDLADIANGSNVPLTSFFWRDTLPVQAVRLDKLVTGTYNAAGNYKIVYKTNLSGDYRTMYDNLNTQLNYTLDASPVALGLASNEYITEFMAVFGVVPAGFRQVEAPRVYCMVRDGLSNGTQFVNQAEAGGVYNGQWIMAASRWVTRVYAPTKPLPRTGY